MMWSPRALKFSSWSPGALHFLGRSPGALNPFGTLTVKFKSAAILALACFYENSAIHSHVRSTTRALSRARGLSMRTYLTAVEGPRGSQNLRSPSPIMAPDDIHVYMQFRSFPVDFGDGKRTLFGTKLLGLLFALS